MRRLFAISLCFCLMMNLFTGCTEKSTLTSQSSPMQTTAASTIHLQTSAINSTTSSSVTSTGEYTGDAQIVSGLDVKELVLASAIPPRVTFSVTAEKKAAINFNPILDTDQTVSVTDLGGRVWSLTIQAHSLLNATEISMTPLTNITSDAFGTLQTGVSLQPDGLQFIKPARLTVTGLPAGGNPVILTGDQSGTELALANMEPSKSESGATANIVHFSTEYADNMSAENRQQKMKDWVDEDLKTITKEIEMYLKQPIQVPVPAAYPMRCAVRSKSDIENQEASLQTFVRQFGRMEITFIELMMSSVRQQQSMGTNNDQYIKILNKLLERLDKKCRLLVQTYYPKEDYIVPIARVVIATARQRQLMGDASVPDYYPKMIAWYDKLAKDIIKELKEQHNYRLFTMAFELKRQADLMGSTSTNIIEQILSLYKFKVEFEVVIPSTFIQLGFKTKGDIDVEWVPAKNAMEIKGIGKGKYQNTQNEILSTTDDPVDTIQCRLVAVPAEFEPVAIIPGFDACEKDYITLRLDRFGSDNEKVIYEMINLSENSDPISKSKELNGYVQATVERLFKDFKISANGFEFNLPLQNGNVVAAEKTFTKSDSVSRLDLTIRVTHTP